MHRPSAADLTSAYAAGTTDPVAVLDEVLRLLDAWEPRINAFVAVERDAARAAATASAERWRRGTPRGSLDGVPVTVKTNIAVAGLPLTGGSAAGRDAPPQTADGPVARLLAQAGAVRIGTTTMPDLGMLSSGVSTLSGVTRSPWDPALTVGGSSSGAGAAAVAGVGPIHVGSDIGGSVRLPAAWLGLVGFKPTYGVVPVDSPYIGRCIGPLTRTVDDAVTAMTVLAAPDARDHTQVPTVIDWARSHDADPGRWRVAVHVDAGWGLPVDPEVAAFTHAAAQRLAAAGADVVEIPPVASARDLDGLDLFLRARSLLDLERMAPEAREAVLPFVRAWAAGAADATGAEVMAAYDSVVRLRAGASAATRDYDLVLSPVAPVAAFPAEWPMPSNDPATSLHHIGFTAPYNFSDQPAVALNAGFTADGRPVGIQLAGRRFADADVLAAARWYEVARGPAAMPGWPAPEIDEESRDDQQGR